MQVFNILKKGDQIFAVTDKFIAVKRKCGEMDLIPITKNENGWQLALNDIIRIGYGDSVMEYETENGVKVIHF